MTSTDMTSPDPITVPAQPSDAAMFAPLTTDENRVLHAHLTSGWYKQSAVYPGMSEPWRQTAGLLDDLHVAVNATLDAEKAARAQAELAEPEAEAGA